MGGGKSIFILHWMFDIRLGLSLEKGNFSVIVSAVFYYCHKLQVAKQMLYVVAIFDLTMCKLGRIFGKHTQKTDYFHTNQN